MSTIVPVTGKKYRILVDAENKVWNEISFRSVASDVIFNDNLSAQEKLGAIKGIVTAKQSTTGYAIDASVAALAPYVISRTLRVGDTGVISIEADPHITSTAKAQIYTDVWGYVPKSVVTTGNTMTITFPAPKELTNVKIEISEF